MLNVELSRRIGKIASSLRDLLTVKMYVEFVKDVEKSTSFNQLPKKWQSLIEYAEENK